MIWLWELRNTFVDAPTISESFLSIAAMLFETSSAFFCLQNKSDSGSLVKSVGSMFESFEKGKTRGKYTAKFLLARYKARRTSRREMQEQRR